MENINLSDMIDLETEFYKTKYKLMDESIIGLERKELYALYEKYLKEQIAFKISDLGNLDMHSPMFAHEFKNSIEALVYVYNISRFFKEDEVEVRTKKVYKKYFKKGKNGIEGVK